VVSKLDRIKEKYKEKYRELYLIIKPYLTWKYCISFSIAWFITNGHAYVIGAIGLWLDIAWAKWYGGIYLATLYGPTPEKLITIPLSALIHYIIFREIIDIKALMKYLHKEIIESIRRNEKLNEEEINSVCSLCRHIYFARNSNYLCT
jgi:hypothetical protein